MEDIIVVGAGASGLMCAIMAAKEGAHVLVLEHMECAGKKILVTGNGKCNFSNKKQGCAYYRGTDPAFVMSALCQFDVKKTIQFFESQGVYTREKNDLLYPFNEEAATVREMLLTACQNVGVRFLYEIGIQKIYLENGIFVFQTKQGIKKAKKCIMATGGYAAKKTGSDGSGFLYLKSFAHPITACYPALVALKTTPNALTEASGVRIKASVRVLINGQFLCSDGKPVCEQGELQLTDYGVSGIMIFQISRFVSEALAKEVPVKLSLDLLPDLTKEEVEKRLFILLSQENKTPSQALEGLFPRKLAAALAKEWNLKKNKSVSKKTCEAMATECKSYVIQPTDTLPFEKAQVTAGGVDTSFVDNETMQSKLVNGLYFCGEILDIDGMCGGYNLQWAFSSGACAGLHAAKSVMKGNES